jgi:hypothetical protein
MRMQWKPVGMNVLRLAILCCAVALLSSGIAVPIRSDRAYTVDPYADPKNSLLPSKLYTFFNYQMNSFIFNATLFETSKLGINTFRQGCRDLVSRNSFPRAIVL